MSTLLDFLCPLCENLPLALAIVCLAFHIQPVPSPHSFDVVQIGISPSKSDAVGGLQLPMHRNHSPHSLDIVQLAIPPRNSDAVGGLQLPIHRNHSWSNPHPNVSDDLCAGREGKRLAGRESSLMLLMTESRLASRQSHKETACMANRKSSLT
eukprot:1153437-Pelagomonas_calceolata.AAC.7